MPAYRSIMDYSIDELARARDFDILDLPMGGKNQRISIYEKPVPNHHYVLGFDSAHGRADGDFDAATIADRNVWPWRQVACLHGRWGETVFSRLLYAVAMYYGYAFIIGERQGGGLANLRQLIDEYGYTYMYYERDEKRAGKPMRDLIGHDASGNVTTLTDLRKVVRDNPRNPTFIIKDPLTLDELGKMHWEPRGAAALHSMLSGASSPPDKMLKATAPRNHHDDLIISASLCLKGLRCVDQYEADRPVWADGTFGALLGHDEKGQDTTETQRPSFVRFLETGKSVKPTR